MDPRESQQWQTIQRCFTGERTPDCTWCPNHHSKNGQCCFGIRYEHGHPDCRDCILTDNCSALTQQAQAANYQTPAPVYSGVRTVNPPNQPVRVQLNYPPPTTRPQTAMSPYQPPYPATNYYQPTYYGPQPGQPLIPLHAVQPMPVQFDDPNWKKHLLSLLGWGMAEGGLELVLHWFRNRRPRPQ